MQWKYFTSLFLLYPFYTFATEFTNLSIFFDTSLPIEKNTIERLLSNEDQIPSTIQNNSGRTQEYSTQIIRITKEIEALQLTCVQVNEEINKILISKITKDKFTYTTYISCTYDPDTQIATRFILNSYFDPINDEAITYLNTYLQQYNGSDLLGTTLTIESAKALIVSLGISVGIKKNPDVPPFIQYREDRSNHYFKSNYDVQINLTSDISKRFFTDEPDKVLPFLDKWIFNHAGTIYKAILRESNYALLQPERIFLMNDGEPIFVSPIKYYYAHKCSRYEHQRCLKQEFSQ